MARKPLKITILRSTDRHGHRRMARWAVARRKEVIERVIRAVLQAQVPRERHHDFTVRVEMRAGGRGLLKKYWGYASVYRHGSGVAVTDCGRVVYQIKLRKWMGWCSLVNMAAHEAIHVAQTVNGRLEYRRVKGRWRHYWDGVDHTDTPYRQKPCEILAYADSHRCALGALDHDPRIAEVIGLSDAEPVRTYFIDNYLTKGEEAFDKGGVPQLTTSPDDATPNQPATEARGSD